MDVQEFKKQYEKQQRLKSLKITVNKKVKAKRRKRNEIAKVSRKVNRGK